MNLVSENGCGPSLDPSVVNLSNSLTVLRIVAIPFILVLMQADTPQSGLWATGVFIAAFITDWLDGFIARKKNQVTRFGKMLDPLADKLLIGSALIMLISLDRVPVWMVILVISREIAVTWLRASLAGKGFILAADRWGKNKTFFQALALIPLILYLSLFRSGPSPGGHGVSLDRPGNDGLVGPALFFSLLPDADGGEREKCLRVWFFYVFSFDKTIRLAYIKGLSGNNSVVECNLAKVEVAGSNPVSRSIF